MVTFQLRPGRTIALAFTALVLGGSIAAASAPAAPRGDVGDQEFGFKDVGRPGVICAYYVGDPSTASYFKIRGPKVQALESYPQPKQGVSWRVKVWSAPTKNGPWSLEKVSSRKFITSVQDQWKSFKTRTVDFTPGIDGKAFLRVSSRLYWHAEDGGVVTWVAHTYEQYEIEQSSGFPVTFGGGDPVRQGACPNLFPEA
jgi:hypothetical protein